MRFLILKIYDDPRSIKAINLDKITHVEFHSEGAAVYVGDMARPVFFGEEEAAHLQEAIENLDFYLKESSSDG